MVYIALQFNERNPKNQRGPHDDHTVAITSETRYVTTTNEAVNNQMSQWRCRCAGCQHATLLSYWSGRTAILSMPMISKIGTVRAGLPGRNHNDLRPSPHEHIFCDKFSVTIFMCSCTWENLPEFFIRQMPFWKTGAPFFDKQKHVICKSLIVWTTDQGWRQRGAEGGRGGLHPLRRGTLVPMSGEN